MQEKAIDNDELDKDNFNFSHRKIRKNQQVKYRKPSYVKTIPFIYYSYAFSTSDYSFQYGTDILYMMLCVQKFHTNEGT